MSDKSVQMAANAHEVSWEQKRELKRDIKFDSTGIMMI